MIAAFFTVKGLRNRARVEAEVEAKPPAEVEEDSGKRSSMDVLVLATISKVEVMIPTEPADETVPGRVKAAPVGDIVEKRDRFPAIATAGARESVLFTALLLL